MLTNVFLDSHGSDFCNRLIRSALGVAAPMKERKKDIYPILLLFLEWWPTGIW
jgi:hypothetical protein